MLEKDKRKANLSILDRLRKQGAPTIASPVPMGFDGDTDEAELGNDPEEMDYMGTTIRDPGQFSSRLRKKKPSKQKFGAMGLAEAGEEESGY